jgi:hypothetical protein
MRRSLPVTLVVLVLAMLVSVPSARAASGVLRVSSSANRSPSGPLSSTVLGGNQYVFVTGTADITKVSFWLDNPTRSGTPTHVENTAPWDFAGTSTSGAYAWNTSTVANGSHTLQILVQGKDGVAILSQATFVVFNGGATPYDPQVSTSANRLSPRVVAGSTLSGSVAIFVPSSPNIHSVAFFLDDRARAHPPVHVERTAPYDFAGTATGGSAFLWPTTSVADGAHVLSVDVAWEFGVLHLDASFHVVNSTPR